MFRLLYELYSFCAAPTLGFVCITRRMDRMLGTELRAMYVDASC